MICISLKDKDFDSICELLESGSAELAEIRLDSCPLSDEEIGSLFSETDIPLVATCRTAAVGEQEALRRLTLAIEAGACFADLEIEAPAALSRRIQALCKENGTRLIRSYHDFGGTPDEGLLQQVLERCFRYGADIAKIVTTSGGSGDNARVLALYDYRRAGTEPMEPHTLIAFAMGEEGRQTRLECLRLGAPFSYCAPEEGKGTAPGQWTAAEMKKTVYGGAPRFCRSGLKVPASKSFAQRAIIAAALAEGCSHLGGYSPCEDSESAIRVAEALGAKVRREKDALAVEGIGPIRGKLGLERLNTGESGLLTRLMIPVLAAVNGENVTIEGEKTLRERPLAGAAGIMASFGVLLKEEKVPITVRGHLIPGTADISGKGGSQLISGLLMALPLCNRDSTLYVSEPKSIPYMFITLDVLRKFGIRIGSQMEGDETLLEAQDWSGCSGITFKVKGGRQYRAADFDIEGDWSSAANFMVAGAIFGSAEIDGLDVKSLQADISICDILLEAGAAISQISDEATGSDTVCVRKAPLEPFTADLNNAPDLFPIVSVLAAFCPGESRMAGVHRLAGKESDRAAAIMEMLGGLGVDARIEDDVLCIKGETLVRRRLEGRLLKGGGFTSRHDHRMVMALKVASLGAESPIVIDDEACVGKSFPEFLKVF